MNAPSLFVVMMLPSLAALGGAPELTLERIFSDPPLDGLAPVQLQLSPGGKVVTFLRPNDKDSDVLDLWGARLPGGKPALLVATADLLVGGKEQRLTEQEKMALERKRITKRGITGYLWCGDDARSLVFPFSGDLFFVTLGDVDGAKPAVTRLTSDEDQPEMNPVCSKSGKKVAFVKKGDVVVMDTRTKAQTKLTSGASAVRTFGLAEFIAQEEMDRQEGMWWSPDERSMVIFEVDEQPVGVKVRAQIFADRTEMFEQRYPAAGEKNAAVTAWLVDVNTKKKVRLQAPADDGYLPRAGFFDDGKAWIQWQSRDQKKLALFEAEASGKLRKILEETDEAWVELHDDLRPLKDNRRLLWSTEKSGRRQIVVVDRATGAFTALTNEPEPVAELLAVDEDAGVVFFSAWRSRGRELDVRSCPLAGGPSAQVTTEPGWHAAKFDDAGKFFVDKRSDFGRPWSTVIKDASGKVVLAVDENPAAELATFAKPTPEWLDLKAADGTTTLSGLLLPPVGARSGRRYPVIATIYGGPHSQTVTRAWGRSYPLQTYWTQQGYGVFLVDNRGMHGRDRAFSRAHHRAFGDVEVKDLFAAVEQIKAVRWVNRDKIGVFGWSYGGFLSARAVLDEKSPFAAAASVAPVTDWRLYDTHYTERYLGVPPSAAYDVGNIATRAKLLSRPLLLVHGTADDNVLFEIRSRLVEALQKEGKLFELMIYPGKAHGISGKPSQLHVYRTITSFFDRTLKSD